MYFDSDVLWNHMITFFWYFIWSKYYCFIYVF